MSNEHVNFFPELALNETTVGICKCWRRQVNVRVRTVRSFIESRLGLTCILVQVFGTPQNLILFVLNVDNRFKKLIDHIHIQ